MKRWVVTLLSLLIFPGLASAQTGTCAKPEAACVLDAAWSAALILPLEKQDRLAPAFLEIAALSRDPQIVNYWEKRFDRVTDAMPTYPDFGWQKAEPVLRKSGVDGLIAAAKQKQAPLSFGRADALLSAGRMLSIDDPVSAMRVNEALLSLSAEASDFEKPSLAHAAAELAMVRCDGDRLTRAIARTDSPRNLRYAFWSARVSGGLANLLVRVRAIKNEQDTRDVRRVLDGYRAILELGYCAEKSTAMGG